MTDSPRMLIILTEGRADNGRKATLAFSMGLSAVAMGLEVSIFLTSDGAVWGYDQSAYGVSVPGFLPLNDLIEQYIETGGHIKLCSTCQLTCGAGDPRKGPKVEKLSCIQVVGMASIVELSLEAKTISF